jgi:hypothetical protein
MKSTMKMRMGVADVDGDHSDEDGDGKVEWMTRTMDVLNVVNKLRMGMGMKASVGAVEHP